MLFLAIRALGLETFGFSIHSAISLRFLSSSPAPLSHNETAAPSNLAPAQYRLLAPCANAIIATLTNGTLLGWGGFSDYLGPRNETVIPVGLQGRGGEIKELVCGAYNPVAVLNVSFLGVGVGCWGLNWRGRGLIRGNNLSNNRTDRSFFGVGESMGFKIAPRMLL